MRGKLGKWAVAVALAWQALTAHALDPRIALDGYRHERWGEAEGAPQSVEALAQSEDGWLWLASGQAGLFRFDGVRFYPYVTRDGSELLQRTVTAMRPGPGNTLWIGYAYGGLTLLRDGRFQHVATRDEIGSSYAIALGPDGTAWVAGSKGLFAVKDGRLRRIGADDGVRGTTAQYVLADRRGRIWFSDGTDLLLREQGHATFERVRQAAENSLLLEDAAGAIWLVTKKQFERVAPPAAAPATATPAGPASSFQSLFDAHGNLWSGNCPVGLCRLRAAERGAQRFSALDARERWNEPWQMHSLRVLSLLEDRDGSVWIGTASGLERLRDQPVHVVPELFDKGMLAAAPLADGSIIALDVSPISGQGGMWRVRGDSVTPLPNDAAAELVGSGPGGTLLLAGPHGIERHGAGGVRHIPLPDLPPALRDNVRIRLVAEDAQGVVWLRIAGHGTRRYANGRWLPLADDTAGVISVGSDSAGRSYAGGVKGRLHIVDGTRVRQYGPDDGIAVGDIIFVHPGPELLISGDLGAQVLHGGRFHKLTFALPLDVGAITGVVAGPDGERWLNSRAGLLRVAARDWAATMANPALPLRATLYDMLDGFPGGGAENNRRKATAFATPDGKLWFAGRRALAWVWPRELPRNPVTPAVEILGMQAGHQPVPLGSARIALPEGTEDVRIDYSAPGLRLPQRVTFRYRLLGAHTEWEDAGSRRTAFYTRLAPGDYTFEVVAVNESGVPGARATRLPFRIEPRWTQTPWFYGACAALVLALATFAYRWRLRQMAERIEERFIVRTRERERIARSLHDTFLQSVQGLVLSVHAVMMKLPRSGEIHAELDRVLARADDVLAEGRNEVAGLRGDAGSAADFWQALRRDVELAAPGALRRVSQEGEQHVALLRDDVRSEAYAIAREALTNALRHTSGAVRLRLAAEPKAFVLEVADAGPGLGQFAQGRAGHFGLAGMRERAEQIGAALRIDSSPAGVTVVLTIPAARAYEHGRRQPG